MTTEASFFGKLEGRATFLDRGGSEACGNALPNTRGEAPGGPPPYNAAETGSGGGGAPPKKVDDCDLNLAPPAHDFQIVSPKRVEEPLPETSIPFGLPNSWESQAECTTPNVLKHCCGDPMTNEGTNCFRNGPDTI